MSETAPTTVNRTLMRLPNAAYRSREYLTEAEVMKLIETARKRGRNGLRDSEGWPRKCASIAWAGAESAATITRIKPLRIRD
jgi:hypothetical protein